MIENYEDIHELLVDAYYAAGKKADDELVKFLFYWQSLQNLYDKYASSSSGERKMLQDYLNHDDILNLLYEKIDLNNSALDVFLEAPVFDANYDPHLTKEAYIHKKLPASWGQIHNETEKSIKNFQIIYSIVGETEEQEFDDVMISLFNTMYKLYNNVSHSSYGEIDDLTARFIKSSASLLELVLGDMINIREEFDI